MDFLSFDLSDNQDGVITLEALASTPSTQHAAVMAEAEAVLAWAWREFPHTHGTADDGMDWDHDLQVSVEDGGWHAVTLTISASPHFAERFVDRFGPVDD